ncbi:MAG: hypothetical protein AAGI52_17700 [Bacteroidota bacterium]
MSRPIPPNLDLELAVSEALRTALDDWLMAYGVAWAAYVRGAWTPAEAKQGARAIIEAVLSRGLMLVGDISDDGFVPWNGTTEEIAARAESMWPDEGDPGLGLFWLDLTESGLIAAEAAQARYEQELLDDPNGDVVAEAVYPAAAGRPRAPALSLCLTGASGHPVHLGAEAGEVGAGPRYVRILCFTPETNRLRC